MGNEGYGRRSFLRTGAALTTGIGISGCLEESESPTTDNDLSTDNEREEQPSPSEFRTDSGSTATDPSPNDAEAKEDSRWFEPEDAETPELGHLHGISGKTYPPNIRGYYHRRYEWSTNYGDWWLELNIPKSLEAYYDVRHRQKDRGMFVSDPYDDEYIKAIARELEGAGVTYGLSDREVVNLAIAFVQQLRYTPDEVATGFIQHTYYPLQTLIDQGGDCEDTSILLAAILQEMGYGVILLAMWDAEHMGVGVRGDSSITGAYYEYNGQRYYYIETTQEGWQVGEIPPSIENTSAEIQEVRFHPTLVYEWQTHMNQSGEIEVTTKIENVGFPTSDTVSFSASFEDRLGRQHARDEVDVGSLIMENPTTKTVTLQPPDDRPLRLNTRVSLSRRLHDSTQSEWRHPV